MTTTDTIMAILKDADGHCADIAHYDIKDTLTMLVDAVDLARKNGDAQLISYCHEAQEGMKETARSLQRARNWMKAVISQLDGFDPEEKDD